VSEQNFDYQEIIHRGQEAARAANAPVLNTAYRMQIDELTARMLSCAPNEDIERKELARQINATANVFGKLVGFIKHAETLLAEQQQQASGPNEYQGFGIEESA
jgi:hypothetical protein